MMEFFFGSRKTPAEQMRECKRTLARAGREMDTERRRLENDETRIQNDIKAMAKKNQMGAVRTLARDLVRSRAAQQKLIMMSANLKAMELKVSTLKTTADMGNVMKKMTLAMQKMNRSVNLPAMQKIMMEFEKQSSMMEMKEEMMNDVMDDVIGEEEAAEESDAIVNQVLSELGIEMNAQLGGLEANNAPLSVPTGPQTSRQPAAAAAGADAGATDPDDLDLEARLNRLKRN